LLKPRSKKNEIEHDYSLVFARDWLHSERFLSETKKLPYDNKTTVIYAESSEEKRLIETLSQKTISQVKEALLILSVCSLIEYTRAWNSSFFFVHEHTEIKLKINLAARSSRPL
jgi:hypothetical protein